VRSLRSDVLAAFVAAILSVGAVAVFALRSDDRTPPPTTATTHVPTTPSPTPFAALVEPGSIALATTAGATVVRSAPDLGAPEISRLREGITLPVFEQREGFLGVLTPCELRGWVAVANVDVLPRATGAPHSLHQATIVIDPGHGGTLTGAVGPSGLPESEPNVDIAARLSTHLDGARVILTRTGDITAGIGYRAAIANEVNAHALVSVHNNAEPDGPSAKPGTETYYQYRSSASKRLAGLVYEELVPRLARLGTDWVADRDAGAKYRLSSRGGDYYALLRGAHVPAVIVESLFIAHSPEEQLLRRPEVREAIAEGLSAALRRFFETSDPGSGFVTPYPREPGPSGKLPAICNDPAP
jgi:N-acetylmuramoyl-L-alanine amidase